MPYIGNITSDFSIDTGNITNRAVTATKLSPSSVGSNGQVLSVDGSGNLQWGNDANAPEGTAVLSTGESGTTKFLRVDGDGTCSWQVPPNTQLSFSNDANNRVVTGTGSGLNGEANLTFDGSTLAVTGSSTFTGTVSFGDAGSYLGSNVLRFSPAGTAYIDHEVNDQDIYFRVSNTTAGQLGVNALIIKSTGDVGIGTTAPGTKLDVSGDIRVKSSGVYKSGHNGSESAPLYTVNDSDTGIFRGANANELAFATAANSRMIIDADGDVGIGTTSPGSLLSLSGANDAVVGLALGAVGDSITASRYIGICQSADNTSIGVNSGFSGIEFGGPSSTNEGYLAFHTHDVGNSSDERVRITKDGYVGIGTASPGSKFSITGPNDTVIGISLGQGLNTLTSSRYIGICQNGNENNLATNSGFQGIEFGGPGSTNEGYLAFHTHDVGVSSAERVRIDKSGNVGIGTTSPDAYLDVVSNDASAYIAEFRQSNTSNSGQIAIDSPTDSDSRPVFIDLQRAGTVKWSIGQGYNSSGGALHFATSTLGAGVTGSQVEITTGGNVKISDGDLIIGTGDHGIDFSAQTATTAGTTSAELFNHYEIGTWTPAPVLTYNPSNRNITSTSNISGTFTKVGNLVHVEFRCAWVLDGSGAFNMGVNGLPFTSQSTISANNGVARSNVDGQMFICENINSAQIGVLRKYNNTGPLGTDDMTGHCIYQASS